MGLVAEELPWFFSLRVWSAKMAWRCTTRRVRKDAGRPMVYTRMDTMAAGFMFSWVPPRW